MVEKKISAIITLTPNTQKAILESIVGRLKEAKTLDSIILVALDDKNKNLGESLERRVIKSNDLIGGLIKASSIVGADVAVWIKSTHFLINPSVVDEMVHHHLRLNVDYTYFFGFPAEMAPEIVNLSVLRKQYENFEEKGEVETLLTFLNNLQSLKVERVDLRPILGDVFRLSKLSKIDLDNSILIYRKLEGKIKRLTKEIFKTQFSLLPPFPKTLFIELTNKCNLKCIMCYQKETKRRKGFMSFDLYQKIIDEGSSNGLRRVRLFIFGEPLLYPHLSRAIKYAKERGISTVEFNTNGQLVDEAKAHELIEAGVDRIVFSVDGATKEVYEKVRKGGRYEKLVKNITYLVELKKKLGLKKPEVILQTMLMKETRSEVRDVVRRWKGLVDKVKVTLVQRQPGQQNQKSLIREVPLRRREGRCGQLWSHLVVYWSGEVGVCCGDGEGKLIIGNLHESSLSDLWHGKKIHDYRVFHLDEEFEKMPLCDTCNLWQKRNELD